MAATPTPTPPSDGYTSIHGRSTRTTLMASAIKRKDSFIQLFTMTGIFMLSCRSLGQKYRINDLTQDNAELRQERDALAHRITQLKAALRREAALDASGALASHLNRLFGEDSS